VSNFPPTPEQQAIIDAVLRGESIIVIALAGAAKSTTIEMAAKAMPQPYGSLALAFNKKIQEELSPRLPFPVKTLNGLGHKAWMDKAGKMPLSADKMSDIRKLFKDDEDKALPWEVSKLASAAKVAGLVPKGQSWSVEGVIEDSVRNWCDMADDLDLDIKWLNYARNMLIKSIEWAFEGKMIDFDDQIYMPVFFGGVFTPVQTLFIDEAQDLSPLNHRLLSKIRFKQLVAVGDPLQSIYGFRGADSEAMEKLEQDFSLKPYKLTMCFRCSKRVASAARYWAEDIKSPEWAKEGRVFSLLQDNDRDDWSHKDVQGPFVVLCRHNAPLVDMALKIWQDEPVSFLNGRAASTIKSLLRKTVNYSKTISPENVLKKIATARAAKLATEDKKKHDRIIDEYAVIEVLSTGVKSYEEIEKRIDDLFQSRTARITFGTGHASKGLEFQQVLWLDSWRNQPRQGASEKAIQQEENLSYVITTRAKENLIYADLKQFSK
jgi:superfamily I DNA/RNA helicase